MKKILWSFILVQSLISVANAAITCKEPTKFGSSIQLTLEADDTAKILVINKNGSKELEKNFSDIVTEWDGHMTGLMTTTGLSIKYENHYGCIRNVVITTNVRRGTGFIDSVIVPLCLGGTTADELCDQ